MFLVSWDNIWCLAGDCTTAAQGRTWNGVVTLVSGVNEGITLPVISLSSNHSLNYSRPPTVTILRYLDSTKQ